MIRDTFETNPGLCELFKRKILSRAQSAGLSSELIDFKTQIDMKGTFQENLRAFYREYPQLAEESDYLRLRSPRRLTGAALEQSWRSYQRSNRQTERPLAPGTILPEFTVTFTIGRESAIAGHQKSNPNSNLATTIPPQSERTHRISTYSELTKLVLDRVTAMAGANVTKTILHQIGREIGSTAYHSSTAQTVPFNLAADLDQVLGLCGFGKVVDLHESEHRTSVTYTCTIETKSASCDVTRGIVSHWLESHLHRKPQNIEGPCSSDGPHVCIFRITFRK